MPSTRNTTYDGALRQLQPDGVTVERRAERAGDRRHDVGQRPVAVGRRGEAPRGYPRVRAESASEKASSPLTASAPSAAAETRSV